MYYGALPSFQKPSLRGESPRPILSLTLAWPATEGDATWAVKAVKTSRKRNKERKGRSASLPSSSPSPFPGSNSSGGGGKRSATAKLKTHAPPKPVAQKTLSLLNIRQGPYPSGGRCASRPGRRFRLPYRKTEPVVWLYTSYPGRRQ